MGVSRRQIFAVLLLALIGLYGGLEAVGLIVALTPKAIATVTKADSQQFESSTTSNDHCASLKSKANACAHCVEACYEGGGHVCGMNHSSSAGLVFAAIPCKGAGHPHAPTLPSSLAFRFLPLAEIEIPSPRFELAAIVSASKTLKSFIAVPLTPPPKALAEVV